MLAMLFVLQLLVPPSGAASKQTLPRDSVVRLRVNSAVRAFQLEWRAAWQETQQLRPSHISGDNPFDTDVRSLALHCHAIESSLRIRDRIIAGSVRSQASCPSWYPPDAAPIDDERHGIDGALKRDQRFAMRPLRATLRALLDSAAASLSGDARIAGQRVRFALDAGAFADAWGAAVNCTSNAVDCGLLRGLVHYRAGHVSAADSAFLIAAAMMSDSARCAWDDIELLLDAETRRTYKSLSCADRVGLERKVWWLADPLYIEPGNERRAEHFARKTLITLLASLDVDERQHWRAEKGGEAVRETLIRYGWPSQMFWGGPFVDAAHDGWLRSRALDTAGPYVARQYTRDRLRTLPLAHALASPFESTEDDWKLHTPLLDNDEAWPVEHYARDASRLVQLPIGQRVVWRRKDAARFVWAADIDAQALDRRRTDSVQIAVFESRAVNDETTVGIFGGSLDKPVVVNAALPAGALLLAIEIPGDGTHAAARTRFGLHVPESLTSGAERSLSQPVLLDATYDAGVQLDADGATAHMLGTTTLTHPRRVGIYWEAYGFAATDTVDLEVQISREDRPGIFTRALGVFRPGQDQDAKVGMRWREAPGSSRAILRLEGAVPMQMRSIVIDIEGLSRGSYRMQISMTTAPRAAVANDRSFVIR